MLSGKPTKLAKIETAEAVYDAWKLVFELDCDLFVEVRARSLLKANEYMTGHLSWNNCQIHQCAQLLEATHVIQVEMCKAGHDGSEIFGACLDGLPSDLVDEITCLPVVIVELMRRLYTEEAVSTIGAFRIDAQVSNVSVDYAFNCRPVYQMSLLKKYFRCLPSSLVSNGVVNLLSLVSSKFKRHIRIRLIQAILFGCVPLSNLKALAALCLLLQAYARHEAANQMSASGLAVCWAPIILDFDLNLKQVGEVITVLEDLISNWDEIFLIKLNL